MAGEIKHLNTCIPDIDECATGVDLCDQNADCSNTEGSYKCICKTGYEGNGRHCSGELHAGQFLLLAIILINLDIDECSTGVSKCDANAYCTNTVGSYKCTCKAGYEGNGFKCTGKIQI